MREPPKKSEKRSGGQKQLDSIGHCRMMEGKLAWELRCPRLLVNSGRRAGREEKCF